MRAAADVRVAVRSARLTLPLSIDGALRLDPLAAPPRLDEAHAIALFRAGSSPVTVVGDVTVVYAAATLHLAVSTNGLVIQPRVVPAFDHRAVWAFIWTDGPHGCPAIRALPAHPVPEPQRVLLIAADGTGDGVSYQTRGSFCDAPVTGPRANLASYYVSLPWSLASHTGSEVVLRYATPPRCGDIEYSPITTTATSATLGVYALVLMAHPPCIVPTQPTNSSRSIPANAALTHNPTGLSEGRFTSMGRFTYFDGVAHTTS
jgi:hypothetical protein